MTWQARVDSNYQRIKAYYESRGGTRWQDVTADPRFFNRVWRNLLRLPKGDNTHAQEIREEWF